MPWGKGKMRKESSFWGADIVGCPVAPCQLVTGRSHFKNGAVAPKTRTFWVVNPVRLTLASVGSTMSSVVADRDDGDGEITMKKFLLGTVGLLALGMAAPATAADLAARPYTKAPPPIVAPIYDWTGFYIGGNGGWGQSRNCWDFVDVLGVPSLRAAASGPVASLAARSAIVGRPISGCLAWKPRAIGRISAASASALSILRSPRAPRPMASASSPARSATPGIKRCST